MAEGAFGFLEILENEIVAESPPSEDLLGITQAKISGFQACREAIRVTIVLPWGTQQTSTEALSDIAEKHFNGGDCVLSHICSYFDVPLHRARTLTGEIIPVGIRDISYEDGEIRCKSRVSTEIMEYADKNISDLDTNFSGTGTYSSSFQEL